MLRIANIIKTQTCAPIADWSQETFSHHMTSCTHPEISAQQKVEQDILWKTLKPLKTPPIVLSRL
jgi:hypothetical protein